MTLKNAMVFAAFGLFLAVSSSVIACSNGPFVETWENAGTVEWLDSAGDCVLQASVNISSPSAATAHFRRADPGAPLRLSFVVSPPPMTTLNTLQFVTLATGTARSVPSGGPSVASLFTVALFGNLTGTRAHLAFTAACSAELGGVCATTRPVEFADFPLRVTVELDMGAGSAGQLRAWLGDDTSGAPQVVMTDLDNGQWEGIDRLGIGVSNVSEQLASMIGNQPFTFSDVTVSDPQLFWGDFESDVAGNIVANAGAISNPFFVSGDTCGGSAALPTIASGSTDLRGPASIYSWNVGSTTIAGLYLNSSIPGMSLFLCPLSSGPSGPCMNATVSGQPLQIASLDPGGYQVVVGSLQPNCGQFSLSISGPLGH